MTRELATERPDLKINVLGMNQIGHESGNTQATTGRTIPWLQDEDKDADGNSDVWLNSFPAQYRDVVILDANNDQIDVYNLTTHTLANADNYATMKQKLIAAAEANQEVLSWTNPVQPLDVNDDSTISPIDALLIINELNTVGGHALTTPTETPPAFIDTNSDMFVSPLDALLVLNYLNTTPPAALPAAVPAEGEAEGSAASTEANGGAPGGATVGTTGNAAIAAAFDAYWRSQADAKDEKDSAVA